MSPKVLNQDEGASSEKEVDLNVTIKQENSSYVSQEVAQGQQQMQQFIPSTTKHHEASPIKSFSPLTKQFLAETKKKEISHREERLLNGVPELPHERD